MRTKNATVNLAIHPKFLMILPLLDEWWYEKAGYELIITSAFDGVHTALHSDHYKGMAIDMRTWTYNGSFEQMSGISRKTIARKLARCLGKHFYVKDERDHFHISFRPTNILTWNDYPFGINT